MFVVVVVSNSQSDCFARTMQMDMRALLVRPTTKPSSTTAKKEKKYTKNFPSSRLPLEKTLTRTYPCG